MASGTAQTPIALDDPDLAAKGVTISTFDPNKVGTQAINVTYAGFTESFGVTVTDNISSITIGNLPKIEYKYGESLDVTGGTIIPTSPSGPRNPVNITSSMVSGFKPTQLGPQTLTVTYQGKTTTYEVNVKNFERGIELKAPTKKVYKLNEKLDLTGGTITLVMADGTKSTPIPLSDPNVTITGFDTSKTGAKEITVTYKGFTAKFGITVEDGVSAIRLKTLPNKLDYKYGEKLDLTGGTLEIVKESGANQIIKLTPEMVSGYNAKKIGRQVLKVKYGSFEGEFPVRVEDVISKLVVKAPNKVEYEYGENMDLTGGTVSIIMASGATSETTAITASMVTGFNSKKEGKQKIEVTYKGLKGSFEVNIVDKIKGISMHKEPNKVQYQIGEKLDIMGGQIAVIKSSGMKILPITLDMVSGFNANKAGTQMITVTYGGFTTKFIAVVNAKPAPAPKPVTKYVYVPTTPAPKPSEPVVEEPVVQEPVVQEPVVEKPVQKPIEEKPTAVLGVKDEKEDNTKLIAAGLAGGIGLGLLLVLLFRKRNVKVFIEENGKFELGGLDKLTKKRLTLDVDKFLDNETYTSKVKVRLNDKISEKLDGKEITIIHRNEYKHFVIRYTGEPYEIILQ